MKPTTVDQYISGFPDEIQVRLQQVREVIGKAAPGAEEVISYGIPTFRLNGNLVHFGGFKEHIGFYPTPSGANQFENELSGYKQGKGSVQFPHDKPLPLKLIEQIVKFRVEENRKKTKKNAST